VPVIDLDTPPVDSAGRRPMTARPALVVLALILVLAAVTGEPSISARRAPAPAVRLRLPMDQLVCEPPNGPLPSGQPITVLLDAGSGQIVIQCGN
jgi:hypothetical protein